MKQRSLRPCRRALQDLRTKMQLTAGLVTIVFLGLLISPAPTHAAVIDKGTLQSLTNLLTVEAANNKKIDVMSSADLRQMLELESERAAVGCEEGESCLAELAGALGARYVLSSELTSLGSLLMLNISLYDSNVGKVVERDIVKASSLEGLAEALPKKLKKILRKTTPKGKKSKTALLVLEVKSILKEKEPDAERPRKLKGISLNINLPDFPGIPTSILEKSAATALLKCIDRTLPRVFQSEARYQSWRTNGSSPNCKEKHVNYGLYNVYQDAIRTCSKAANSARGTPLAKDAAAFSEWVTSAFPLIQEAAEYYQDEDFLEDKCKQGKAFHPLLKKAFAAFRRLGKSLVPKIEQALLGDLKEAISSEDSPHRVVLLQAAEKALIAATVTPLMRDDVISSSLTRAFKPLLKELKKVKAISKTLKNTSKPDGHFSKMVWPGLKSSYLSSLRHFKRPLKPYKKKMLHKQTWAKANAFDPLELREVAYEMVLDLTSVSML